MQTTISRDLWVVLVLVAGAALAQRSPFSKPSQHSADTPRLQPVALSRKLQNGDTQAHNPFKPPKDKDDVKSSKGDIVSHNRNEMHKGGPGPTPWTRWTERPRPRDSPWQDKSSDGDQAQCNGRPYNAREQICCQGVVQKRQGLRPACCGSASFDFVFNLCCDGQVRAKTAGNPFCNSRH